MLNIKLDKQGGKAKTHEKCRKCVLDVVDGMDLVDIWRREHPTESGCMWTSYTAPYIHDHGSSQDFKCFFLGQGIFH